MHHEQLAAEFNERTGRGDGQRVIAGLAAGMDALRDLLYLRLHADVERLVGRDSMLMPVSEKRSESVTKLEIDLYQVVESAALACEAGYAAGEDWYTPWLARLRVGPAADDVKVRQRLAYYAAKPPHQRELAFTDVLSKAFPESRRAPLVLFQLLPPAVGVATAMAFGDRDRAAALRETQRTLLPAIGDCGECGGRLLENGQTCGSCENPLWKAELLASD